jgi:excisionase family DNA binding protein
MSDELVSPRQAAEVADCHQDTVRRAIEFGYLPAQRVGKTWAIKLSDVRAWVEAGKPNHRRKSTRKPENEPSSGPDPSTDHPDPD